MDDDEDKEKNIKASDRVTKLCKLVPELVAAVPKLYVSYPSVNLNLKMKRRLSDLTTNYSLYLITDKSRHDLESQQGDLGG